MVSTVSGVTSKAGEITPNGAEVSQSMNRMKRLAERTPLGWRLVVQRSVSSRACLRRRLAWKTSGSDQWPTM